MASLSLKRQFGWSVVAQTYSQALSIGIQLAVLPLMVWLWGTERYGSWIVLAALPTYLAMSDLGVIRYTANDMTARVAKGDVDGAQQIYQTTWLMVVGVAAAVIVLGSLAAFTLPIADLLNLKATSPLDASLALTALMFLVAATLCNGVSAAGLRSTGRFALTQAWDPSVRLLEAITLLAAASQTHSLAIAALCVLGVRVVCAVGLALTVSRHHPWLAFSIRRATLPLLRRIIGPSASYLSFTLGQAVILQGTIIATGVIAGPATVVVVSAINTLTRTGRTAVAIVNHALQPIFSQLSGAADEVRMRKVIRRQLAVTGAISIFYLVSMLLLGPAVLEIWTHGQVSAPHLYFALITVSVFLEIIWFSLQTPFVSINRHSEFALYYLGNSICAAALIQFLMHRIGLYAVGVVYCAASLSLLAFTLVRIRRMRLDPNIVTIGV
jgi:O-antigen/teichoic acid export membrane protein